ncbi:MAG: hypothetical protein DRG11_00940 [Epsilonproteobacteria bacterium]|nr:MAG: hypothetical protein DRG11_00940 [Campylobacterota bacterium]
MSKYDALFEYENDIFGGTPLSKFYDIARQSSDDVVKTQFEFIAKKFAKLEMELSKLTSDDNVEKLLKSANFDETKELNNKAKSLLLEWTGDIVMRLDS